MVIEVIRSVDYTEIDIKRLVQQVLLNESDDVVKAIKRDWPVNTGRSAKALKGIVTSDQRNVELTVVNDVEYSEHIKPKGSSRLVYDISDDVMDILAVGVQSRIEAVVVSALNSDHSGAV